MKKYLLSCIAFSVLLFTGCADENMPTTSTESTEPGITVSMDLAANLQVPNSSEGTRAPRFAIGYKGNENADPTKSHGYPIPIGIFNERSNSATEIADGTEVPVYCIFMSTDKNQPVTKVVTKWTYKKGGNLRLAPTSTFEMAAGTDLTKGTWYVCGILGGEQLSTQVKFNGYSEGHTTISRTGEEVTWGADIPYLFSWRKLEANAAKKSFKADKAVLFKQFGTIVRLRVENNTGFDFQYNGVRIITSNILRGQFDLKVFDKKYHDFLASTLNDTQDSDVANASSESFQKAFKMFKFYQRPLDDAAMTGEIKVFGKFNKDYEQEIDATNKVENTALTYYDHIFLNRAWDKVYNGQKAPSYIYVWMAPQTQAVKTYLNKEAKGDSIVEHVQKTQFLLFAKPLDGATSTRANNEPVPTSINMIPAYGTLKPYVSGANYVANGKVVFEYAPLSYIAKHDNFGTEAEVESTSNQTIPATNRYAFSELSSGTIPNGYKLASHLNWRTIFAQGHGFAGLRKETSGVYDINGTLKYPYSIGYVSYAQMPNASEPVRVFHTYSSGKNLPAAQQGHIAYMIGMAKKPSYITDDLEGNFYQGRTKQPAGQVRSGMDQTGSAAAPWITDNKYQYVMRWEDKDYANKTTGRAVLSQRYLGPRFVLDMDDIAREEFWTLNPKYTNEYPEETSRTFPLGGFYAFEKLPISGGEVHAWYLQEASKGVSTQYWTTDPVFNAGRYAQEVRNDKNGNPPYYAVTFRALDNASGMSGFFYYLYKGVPLNQDKDITVPSTTYQKNLIEKAPVRLWRTTPAKD
ncbi:hypothetical protein [Hoylesella nanceiensis]